MFSYRPKGGNVMVSCLILQHSTITSLTKCKMLRFIFKDYVFEIEVLSKDTAISYIYDVEKHMVWRAFALFETTNMIVGYGFGKDKVEARWLAEDMLETWNTLLQQTESHPQLF